MVRLSPALCGRLNPLSVPDVPVEVTQSENPIDAFIAEKYKEKGLQPTVAADKLTLLRRVYFDLIGLPPTDRRTTGLSAG